MPNAWAWATAGPRERADWVRQHRYQCKDAEQIRAMFNLTVEGVDMILRGNDWRPEYEAPAVNYIS